MNGLTIEEISTVDEFQVKSLRDRASTSSRSFHTHHYRATWGGLEVAFVSVDIRPNVDFLVLYEIFVDPGQRRRGVGTRIVGSVEELALRLGRRRISLWPHPFDSTIGEPDLKAWYGRLGYKPREDVPGELEKSLDP